MGNFADVRADIDAWCEGRDWRPRAALLALLVWQAARPLRDSDAGDVFRGINFGAHKFDHLFFCSVASDPAPPNRRLRREQVPQRRLERIEIRRVVVIVRRHAQQ